MTHFKVGDKVQVRKGLRYTQAMQGKTFEVIKIENKWTYNVTIAHEWAPVSGLKFRAQDLVKV